MALRLRASGPLGVENGGGASRQGSFLPRTRSGVSSGGTLSALRVSGASRLGRRLERRHLLGAHVVLVVLLAGRAAALAARTAATRARTLASENGGNAHEGCDLSDFRSSRASFDGDAGGEQRLGRRPHGTPPTARSSGRRSVPPMRPMRATAHLTGIGLDSTNRLRCRATRRWSICVAPARSPRRAAATMSAMARGATFAVTEMTPTAPTPMASRAVRSSPLSTLKSGRTAGDELAHARRLTHGFLDADDARHARQARDGGRQQVDRGAARHVVEQHRNRRVRGDRLEMQEQTLPASAAHKPATRPAMRRRRARKSSARARPKSRCCWCRRWR